MSILYKSARIGKDEKPFLMYKFRTMIEGADRVGESTSVESDPRITKIGKILRKTKLDELPQIINILKGEMSLVGPRPEVKEVVNLMTEEEKRVILSVKPGVTGLDSLWNYDEASLIKKYQEKGSTLSPHEIYMQEIWPVKKLLQREYVSKKSFLFDSKIICLTILNLLLRPAGRY